MRFTCIVALAAFSAQTALAQPYGEPDTGSPGDRMIQEYLAREAARIDDDFLAGIETLEDWHAVRPRYKEEYFHMLGLWPLPEKTPLEATVAGTLERDGYVVETLHYQSIPRLYVTANLYRPAEVRDGEKLPAVLYVCGHAGRGRNGNKTAYQSHGIWLARHGYVCLMVDTLQLGEINATHHGTYREQRWWWHSRGYTPAGVECWNGVRGIDYLISRPEVDPERIAVTGISGGGAATFWVAAADERVKVAVPVSGMADLESYVGNRVINGHCDCMFLYNTFQWPWTRIAALIAPRPLLFVNSDDDPIFPMDANRRVINRLEDLYSLYGAGDMVDSVVSVGGHAYRQDIRQAAFRFLNMHLKGDPSVVTDTEVDLVEGDRQNPEHPIPPEQLRAFPTDADIPSDQLNTTIDEYFVPMARVEPPREGEFDAWKQRLLAELRRVAFRSLPKRIPAATNLISEEEGIWGAETEPGISVMLQRVTPQRPNARRVILHIQTRDEPNAASANSVATEDTAVYVVEPRGCGASRWTRNNPPNYVERSHVLLGTTVDTGRVRDVIAVARHLKEIHPEATLEVHGEGPAGVIAAYAALWEPEIDAVVLRDPSASHMGDGGPQFLNVLRVCDVPDVLGLLAPRQVTILDDETQAWERTAAAFSSAGAADSLKLRKAD